MQVLFTHQFEKQIKKIKNKLLAESLENAIIEVKDAASLSEIKNLKKLMGAHNAYRIRLGDYRIGLYISEGVAEFSCFMNRKEIYRYFP